MSLINWHSSLGIIVIIFFVISIGLYVCAIIKREKSLSPKEAIALLEKRKQYLPDLVRVLEEKIQRHDELKNKASHCPFEEYGSKYFWSNKKYRDSVTKHPNKASLAIQVGFWSTGFVMNNMLYLDLIKSDPKSVGIQTKYDLLYSRIEDKKLKKLIKDYWYYDNRANSMWIFVEMMKISKQKIKINQRKYTGLGINKMIDVKNKSLTKVMKRIDELLEGADDE